MLKIIKYKQYLLLRYQPDDPENRWVEEKRIVGKTVIIGKVFNFKNIRTFCQWAFKIEPLLALKIEPPNLHNNAYYALARISGYGDINLRIMVVDVFIMEGHAPPL